MEEYIVERTLKRRVKTALLYVFITLIIGLFFAPIETLADMSTAMLIGLYIMRIMVIVVWPIMFCVTVDAIKDLWNDKPYLIIRKDGLIQNMLNYQSGLIRWDDIRDISISHTRDHDEGSYEVRIYLKDPEKHIKDLKMLNKIRKMKEKYPRQSDLSIHTGDFKNEGKRVVRLIEEYYNESKKQNLRRSKHGRIRC